MSLRRTAVVLLVLSAFGGCRIEHATSRDEEQQQKLAAEEKAALNQPTRRTPPPTTDDAVLVLAACGRPSQDNILAIYNKMDNGPVRRMVYTRRQTVTIDFIPSLPVARSSVVNGRLEPSLPPNSVWRFDEARMEQEEMLTANRLAFYLPCAANALSREY